MLEFPVRYVHRNILFTRTGEVFALYRLNGVSYAYLPEDHKREEVMRFYAFLHGFRGRGQLLYLTEELWVDVAGYMRPLPLSGDPAVRGEAQRHVESAVWEMAGRAQRRRVYLCLQLLAGSGKTDLVFSLKEVRDLLLERLAAVRKPGRVPESALRAALLAEEEIFNHSRSFVNIERAGLADLEFIVKRCVRHYGPLPPVLPGGEEEGVPLSENSLLVLSDGAVFDPKLRYMKVSWFGDSGEEESVYQTFLTFADVPRNLPLTGHEWLFRLESTVGFPVDAVVHFRLESPEKAARKVQVRKKRLKEQLQEHYIGQGEAPLKEEWAAAAAGGLEAKLEEGMPLMEFAVVLAVAGPDLNEVRARARTVAQLYKASTGFRVGVPPGDMLRCAGAFFPGARFGRFLPRVHADPGYLASAAPFGVVDVGDGEGFFIGWASPGRTPVFYLPGRAMQRGSGLIACVGTQGGGKSMLAKLIAYLCALCGARVFIVDPKNEMGVWSALPFPVRRVELTPGGRLRLNPFRLSRDPHRAASLVKDFLDVLLESHREETASRRLVLNHAVQRVMSLPERERSMIALLRAVDDIAGMPPGGAVGDEELREARVCSRLLRLCQDNAVGAMLFGSDLGGGVLDFSGGGEQVTVVSMHGLPLPRAQASADDPYLRMSESERIAVAVLFLVAAAAREALFSERPERLKVLLVDEAYHLLRVPIGERLLNDLALMSRSFNIVPILIAQNPSEFGPKIRNNTGYVFAFRLKDRSEIEEACAMLGIPCADETVDALRGFGEEGREGWCFMRDPDFRVAEVHVRPMPEYLLEVFDTRPGRFQAAK
ncbi:ATP-binding protein [Ammonifex thiophilus]|uniref:DUF87 domain-containing protein n=1 Tax=Ammonifex thiophilus TaxID=444093 RepID=A0A3D8P3F5_9THEO|nr:ATP-binding protein [Ammonifex thiophilus]RDV81776.1 hypothetical protein DXX99_08730 [Ammonifex thiophilus]